MHEIWVHYPMPCHSSSVHVAKACSYHIAVIIHTELFISINSSIALPQMLERFPSYKYILNWLQKGGFLGWEGGGVCRCPFIVGRLPCKMLVLQHHLRAFRRGEKDTAVFAMTFDISSTWSLTQALLSCPFYTREGEEFHKLITSLVVFFFITLIKTFYSGRRI